MNLTTVGIGVVVLVIVLIILLRIGGSLLRKVGPNQALIVYGTGGTKIITGGAQFVIPFYQS